MRVLRRRDVKIGEMYYLTHGAILGNRLIYEYNNPIVVKVTKKKGPQALGINNIYFDIVLLPKEYNLENIKNCSWDIIRKFQVVLLQRANYKQFKIIPKKKKKYLDVLYGKK